MSHIPSEAEKVVVDGATVDFYKLAKDGQSTYYFFDTSKEAPPSLMVNAMAGLALIKGTNDTLVKVVFSYNENASGESDLTQTSCAG